MIPRTLEPVLHQLANQYPVLTVTGPRQSGKTTLCRSAFADKPYVNLESPDIREFALVTHAVSWHRMLTVRFWM